ncbi:MAG: permease-like cell division protein FtsX [Candidatus Marinimicrobia bacterium]|nr:permease-like cell division protein FtsX [Candidatus Neomarinimicrobiota bacterium]
MKPLLRITWTHIRRSPYQSLAAVTIMTLTFFIISIFTLLGAGSQVILNYFETRPQVTAFFKDETTPSQIDLLKAKLVETGKIKEMKYVSKEEALAIYREQNKDDPLLLEMVTANILPASLEVSTTNIVYLGDVAEILRQESGVEEVIFQEDIVKALHSWTTNIRLIGLGLALAFSFAALLTILVIIGMKVALRREEVEIMGLIGASKGFIRFPFLLEGIFYGAVGVMIAWLVSFLLLLYATPFLVKFLAGIPILPVPLLFMLGLLAGELLLGAAIGTLGSFLAVRRYLK